jgi:hypothetical protein
MPQLSDVWNDLPDNPPNIITLGQQTFGRGVISVVDESNLPRNAFKEGRNLTLAEDGAPKVRPGVDWYGTAPSADAIDGGAMHIMVDDVVHLLVIAGGKVYRSLNDGASWSVCATSLGVQAVFTAGKKVRNEQANYFTYLFNGWDNIVRYDGTLVLATYTALPTPTTVSLTKVGLGGGSQPYTYRYRVAAVNEIGYTIASTALTLTSDRTRDTNDATNYMIFKWNAVPGALRYDIYVGLIAGEESYIDSAENTLEYQDKGAAIEQVSVTAPDSNTTQGPRVADMALIGSRLYATADRDYPYRVWISGAGRYIGAFGSAYESTYLDWQKGGQIKPVKIEDYRKGNNDPVATVWCRSKDGRGAVLQGTLEAFTVGDVTFPVPNFFKLPGSRGTDAPDSVVNVLNDYMYYNSQAIFNLGSRAQFLNLLSTDEASANIRPHVQRIRKSAAEGIAAHFQDAKVLMSVPYESDTNNYTIIFDTERKGWLPEGFTIGFERFFDYTDTTSEEDHHLLCWKKGDTRLSQISDTIRGDYGVAFETTFITGLMHVNPKDRFEFLWAEEGEIEVAQPQGNIQIELSGITREDGFKRLGEPKWIRPKTEKHSWTTHAWGDHVWTDTTVEVVSYSEPSTKRYFNVQQDINAYQYRINTTDLNADYILRTLQVKGTATQGGKPREWELFDE